MKVYVCSDHLAVMEEELDVKIRGLTEQLHLHILDSTVSVSALVEGEVSDGR